MLYNKYGEELPDPTPLELPVGFTRPPTLDELVARLVIDPHTQAELKASGIETEEEANDFDIPDDLLDPTSPYQTDDTVMTDADEMRNGFRERPDVNAILKKAYKEAAEAIKEPQPPKLPEVKTDAKD